MEGKKDQKHVIFIDSRTQRETVMNMIRDLGYTGTQVANIAGAATSGLTGTQMAQRAREFQTNPKMKLALIDKTSTSGYNLQSGDAFHVLGAPLDASEYLQGIGRIARMPRKGNIEVHSYKYSDNPVEQAHWNSLETQIKILKAVAPAMVTEGA